MKVRIILRTCSESSVHFKTRFVPLPKEEIIVHCLKSLLVSLKFAERGHEFSLTIVDDHSNSRCVSQIQETIAHCSFPTEFIPLEKTGNNASMKYCYEYGHHCPESTIYFLEDDYLHSLNCLYEMLDTYELFGTKLAQFNPHKPEIAVMPVDNMFHYNDNTMFSSPLAIGRYRHWRVNYYSNWTMMLSKRGLLENWAYWWKLSDYQLSNAETHEDATVVPVFRNNITLFTPVPTLALHVALPSYVSPFTDWQKMWMDVHPHWDMLLKGTLSPYQDPTRLLNSDWGAASRFERPRFDPGES